MAVNDINVQNPDVASSPIRTITLRRFSKGTDGLLRFLLRTITNGGQNTTVGGQVVARTDWAIVVESDSNNPDSFLRSLELEAKERYGVLR